MKKFLTVLCLCFVSIDVSAATYSCKPQSKPARDAATLELLNGKYLICGHQGTDGCNDGAVVYSDKEKGFYKCDSSYRNRWELYPLYEYKSCINDFKLTDYDDYKLFNDHFIFFSTVSGSAKINNSCEAIVGYMEVHCKVSGGVWRDNRCDCPEDTMQHVGKFDVCKCECKDGFKRGNDKKCYPENVVTEKIDNNENTTTESVNEIGNKNSVETETKVSEIKYNYKSCSSDSVCTGIDNTKRPYLHSTAWHCAWQSAGVRVCTATACESGWTPINGYCQENKNTQTPQQSENKNANSVSGIKTETKTTVKKTCTDLANMDSSCKCIVVGTVERNGTCVCSDSNKEIKNGKCEWTAKYVAGLESDLDSKFNSLTATIGGFEKNVWRDENGEFNTARLASDSIAGVVLGTVGGIVTANLVKKAQVKQGFEDIGCYIGGQSVAGFGDEFNVGR